MKKFLKGLGIAFLVLAIISSVLGAVMNHEKPEDIEISFEAEIIEANNHCPISLSEGVGEITSIKLKDNCLTYTFSYEKNFYDNISNTLEQQKLKDVLFMCMLCPNNQATTQRNCYQIR